MTKRRFIHYPRQPLEATFAEQYPADAEAIVFAAERVAGGGLVTVEPTKGWVDAEGRACREFADGARMVWIWWAKP